MKEKTPAEKLAEKRRVKKLYNRVTNLSTFEVGHLRNKSMNQVRKPGRSNGIGGTFAAPRLKKRWGF